MLKFLILIITVYKSGYLLFFLFFKIFDHIWSKHFFNLPTKMDQKNKSGLLPKWIYVATTIKITLILCVLLKSTFIDKHPLTFNYFYIAHFLLISLRLLNVKRIRNTRVFIFITLTFCVDIIIYLFERRLGVCIYRTVFEVLFSIFSILWMVFLYPYYLVDGESLKND